MIDYWDTELFIMASVRILVFWAFIHVTYVCIIKAIEWEHNFYWFEPFRMAIYTFITYYIIEGMSIFWWILLFIIGEVAWASGIVKEEKNGENGEL